MRHKHITVHDPTNDILVFHDGVLDGKFAYGDQFDQYLMECARTPEDMFHPIIPVVVKGLPETVPNVNLLGCRDQHDTLEIIFYKVNIMAGNHRAICHTTCQMVDQNNTNNIFFLIYGSGVVYIWAGIDITEVNMMASLLRTNKWPYLATCKSDAQNKVCLTAKGLWKVNEKAYHLRVSDQVS